MRTLHTESKYAEWFSPDEMLDNTRKWLSELRLIKDEHLFFENVLHKTALELLPKEVADKFEFIHAINKSEKRANMLIGMVKSHRHKIEIVMDNLDQLQEEKLYKYEHKSLIDAISGFKKNFNTLKSQLFDIVKRVKREEEIRGLINNRKDYLTPSLN